MAKKTGKIKYILIAAAFLCLMGIVFYYSIKNTLVHTYEIRSNDGFSFEDVRLMRSVPSVRSAYAIAEMQTEQGDAVTVRTLHEKQMALSQGRLPENAGEVLIGSGMNAAYGPGDFIALDDAAYKITGVFDSESYPDDQIMCLPAALQADTFFRMGVEVYGDRSVQELLGAYIEDMNRNRSQQLAEENKQLVDQLQEKYSLIQDASADDLQVGKEKLEDASALLADGEDQIRDYEKQIADGESELASYKQLLEEGLTKINDGKRQLDDAKAQIEDARKELADELAKYGYSMEDLASAEQTLKDAEKKIQDGESELAVYEKELNKGSETLQSGKRKLDDAKAEIEKGRSQLNAELAKYGFTISDVLSAEQAVREYTQKYDITTEQLYEIAQQYTTYEQYIVALKDRSTELMELLKNRQDEFDEEYNARIEAAYTQVRRYYEQLRGTFIHSGLDLSIDSLNAIRKECESIISFFSNAEHIRLLVENQDKIREAIASYRLLQSSEKEYDAKYSEYLDGLETFREEKAKFNDGKEKLQAAKKEYEEKKQLVEKAVDANNRINASQKEYDEKYQEYLTGLDTYQEQKAQYDAAAAELEDAKDQVKEAQGELAASQDEYDEAKEKYDAVSAEIGEELDAIQTEIGRYEAIRNKLDGSWTVSDCRKITYDKAALPGTILAFVLACAAFFLGCQLVGKTRL